MVDYIRNSNSRCWFDRLEVQKRGKFSLYLYIYLYKNKRMHNFFFLKKKKNLVAFVNASIQYDSLQEVSPHRECFFYLKKIN